jgi:hypothetical protein
MKEFCLSLGDKFIGTDLLKDTIIKRNVASNLTILSKCAKQINAWLNHGNVPKYLE